MYANKNFNLVVAKTAKLPNLIPCQIFYVVVASIVITIVSNCKQIFEY